MDAPRRQRRSEAALALLTAAVLALAAFALSHNRSTPGAADSLRSGDQPAVGAAPSEQRGLTPAPSPVRTATPLPPATPEPRATRHGDPHPAVTPVATPSPAAASATRRPEPTSTSPAATASASPTPTAHTTTIVISGYAYHPGTLRITVGETVTVTNTDPADHDLTSDEWSTGNLRAGQSQQHTFNAAGTFDYLCSIHPSMTGTIVVS